MGEKFDDPLRPTVNRFLDSLLADDPEGHCQINQPGGSLVVISALIEPEGVRLLLDRTEAPTKP